ncbi:MAG: Crp/Fnr family transcriptional regulator [Saprospiraceae bacterium]|nr:Crp/Fnr family transcriptional regulator [Saprospiraceae bacterium]
MTSTPEAISILNSHFPFLREEDLEEIFLISQLQQYRKRDRIHEVGDPLNHVYFLLSGYVRGFIIDSHNNDRSTSFRKEGEFFGDPEAVLNRAPSTTAFEVVESSTVLVTPFFQFQILASTNIRISQLFIIGLQKALFYYMEHNRLLLETRPEVRCDILMGKKPEIFQKVSRKHIATYLGITPNSLSRILKRKNSKRIENTLTD